MLILGISGKRGVGKNFLAENYIVPEIINNFNKSKQIVPYFFSFGSFVKSELYSRDTSNTLNYENLFLEKNPTTRLLLQSYGTENGREIFREDMWIRCVDIWIKIHMDSVNNLNKHLETKLEPLFIIEDVRFENEYEYVRSKNGVLILIEAPKRNQIRIKKEFEELPHSANSRHSLECFRPSVRSEECETAISNSVGILENTHLSEKGLEHLDFDFKINNDPENSIKVVFEIKNITQSFFKPKSLSFDSSYIETANNDEIKEIFLHSFRH